MRINERRLNGVPVLELEGTLTCPLSDSLVDAVRRVATEGPPRLVIHLGGVPSIDAAGLGALVSAFRVVTSYGGTLRLAQVQNRVQTLLDVCGLGSLFAKFDSVDAAVAESEPVPDFWQAVTPRSLPEKSCAEVHQG